MHPQSVSCLASARPKTGLRGLLWHHDNTSVHTAGKTIDFFTQNGVTLLPHPPYSPDLAPCDFFLFPKAKEKLRGIHFSSPEEARRAYEEVVFDIPHERWSECFNKWFERMKRCLECNGEYFERL